jgi:hypothetical protein
MICFRIFLFCLLQIPFPAFVFNVYNIIALSLTINYLPLQVFKVFLSPQPALQVDDSNVLNSKDVRLLRRMARYAFGYCDSC